MRRKWLFAKCCFFCYLKKERRISQAVSIATLHIPQLRRLFNSSRCKFIIFSFLLEHYVVVVCIMLCKNTASGKSNLADTVFQYNSYYHAGRFVRALIEIDIAHRAQQVVLWETGSSHSPNSIMHSQCVGSGART